MTLDQLAASLPDFATDLRRNLSGIATGERIPLTPQQLWGTLLASAIASRSPHVLRALAPEAGRRLSPAAYDAARSAASTMAMTNVFHRTRHQLSDPAYRSLPARLRVNILGNPGVDRADYDLWCVAVSAINGCGACLDDHEGALRRAGVAREVIQEGFRIASVVHATAVTLDAEAALNEDEDEDEDEDESGNGGEDESESEGTDF